MNDYFVLMLILALGISRIGAVPVAECPPNAISYFLADTDNRCIFYWCSQGKRIVLFNNVDYWPCGANTGTSPGSQGDFNICDQSNAECTGFAPTQPQTTTQPTPTVPDNVDSFENQHGFGATRMDEYSSDVFTCIFACKGEPSCYAVDYDTRLSGSCWFHNATTVCGELEAFEGITHYRLVDCDRTTTTTSATSTTTTATTTTTTTPPTTSTTTTTTTPSTTTTMIETTTRPNDDDDDDDDEDEVPEGFLEAFIGYNALGGSLLMENATFQQCRDACLMLSNCLSLDYNKDTRRCWGHGVQTYCNAPVEKESCIHLKKAPCIEGARNDLVEVSPRFHALGGVKLCDGCTVNECLMLCFYDGSCQGVDYDERNYGCYKHNPYTVCMGLIFKQYCTHYTRVTCNPITFPTTANPSIPTEPPVTMPPAPQDGFTMINHPGPSVLPSGCAAYPGMNYPGSTSQIAGPGIDGDDCLQRCKSSTACLAVNFDSTDGRCYGVFTEQEKCDILVMANSVYHIKKEPACEFFFGTTVEYPDPIESP